MFPHLYHAHHSLHSEDLAFWLDLAAKQPGPILELGCGTGRILIPLAQSGHTVVGLDNDPGMLALLKSHLPPLLSHKPLVIQADFTQFHLGRTFGLVLMPCNTYSTLSPEARRSTLVSVRAHFQPGGMFAVCFAQPRLAAQLARTVFCGGGRDFPSSAGRGAGAGEQRLAAHPEGVYPGLVL